MQKEIVLSKSGEAIKEVSSALFTDKIGGELTLSFHVRSENILSAKAGELLTYDGQIYRIVTVNRGISDGTFLGSVSAEHISFSLADEEFDLENFVYTGSASGAFSKILSGTGFTGTIDTAVNVSVEFAHGSSVNRRTLLNELCGKVGGELIYSGMTIRITSHRGKTARYVINREYPVADFEITETEDGTSYEMTTDTADGLEVGDEVRLSFGTPFELEADTRIIAISYNPYYRKQVVISMGEHQPDIVDDLVAEREETDSIRDSLKDYVKDDEVDGKVSASVDTYINSEGGRASLVHSLKGEYISAADAEGFVKKTNISAEIAAYIDTEAGTGKIVQNLTGRFVKSDELGNYVEKTNLSTEIGQYIDTQSGTAKIISAVEGTYQTITGMSEYAKVTAISKIEQSVSNVQSAITLTSSYTNNTIGTNVYALLQLVSNANSSSIKIKADKIDFTGFTTFLRASDLGSGGSTTIDGGRITTGTISADRIDADKLAITTIYGKSTYAAKPIIGTNVTTSNLQVYIGMEDVWTTPLAGLIELGVKPTGNVYIGTFAITSATSSYVNFDVSNTAVTAVGNWTLGTTTSPWKKIVVGSASYYFTIDGSGIIPNASVGATTSYFRIGSSTYPVNSVHCNKLYVGGKELASLTKTDINTLYATSSYYLKLDTSYNLVANTSGFSLGSTSYPFDELYIGTSTYYWKFTNAAILPSSKTTSYFDIGSSSIPIYRLYAQKIYIDGTELAFGAGKELKMGGSTSYYIVANTSRELRPGATSSTYPFYLGTSTYYWDYAYIGSTASYIGKSASSKLGFFGTTPTTRQTVSSSATVATLITALKAYGLIG